MRIRHALALALVAAVALVSNPALTATEPAAPQYTIEDLGDFGPDMYPHVTGINRHGDVVGWVQSTTDLWQVRAWRRMHDAAGIEILRGDRAWAMAINDAGVVVGFEALRDGTSTSFQYSDALGFRQIDALNGLQSAVASINNAGDVAGVYLASSDGAPRAFRTVGTTLEDLGVFHNGSGSWALAMNDAAQVTGYSFGGGWSFRMAFRYTTGVGLQNLGTLGGSDSEGNAINARGQVAGTAVTGFTPLPRFHAFRYTDGVEMQDVAPHLLASNGLALNNAGDVVGRALFVPDVFAGPQDIYEAFLYTDAGGTVNLNDLIDRSSGWILRMATGINDSGHIVGIGELNGQRRAFKLTKDIEPPVITTAAASLGVLWPPDGRMEPVSFTVSAADNFDPQPACRIATIASSEPDGSEQFVLTGPLSATFAAARWGYGTGRVYTVTLRCSDRAGNAAERQVLVTVPRNQ